MSSTSNPDRSARLRSPNLIPLRCATISEIASLYLSKDGHDTLNRIQGAIELWSIDEAVSSGCIRMLRQDIIDLHRRVLVGTRVVVLDTQGAVLARQTEAETLDEGSDRLGVIPAENSDASGRPPA